MAEFTDSSHNILFTLNRAKWMADLTKSAKSDLTGYQEAESDASRAVLAEFCAVQNRALYHPRRSGNPISWRTSVFEEIVLDEGKKARGRHDVHLGAIAMGINAKFNPPRDFTWVGLKHRPTGKTVLRINVHPLAGGTSRESAPHNTDTEAHSVWKDWAIGQYWLDVISFVAGQMSIQEAGRTTTAPFWDVILLGGDYNGPLDNVRRWYYPGALLPSLFEPDALKPGLDHLQHAHGSDVEVVRRWKVGGHTDHDIHFVKRKFATMADFPRER